MLSSNTSQVSNDAVFVEEVFSTYLYTGNGNSARSISNGIDLSTKGGMVWLKNRTNAYYNNVFDTSRGVDKRLYTNTTDSQVTTSGSLTAFNTDGFSLGTASFGCNDSGNNIVSWTFRKQPKFFDVVTYTGDGVSGRKVSHNLGSVPGAIFVKATSDTSDWCCMVRASDTTYASFLSLNTTGASAYTGVLGDPPTSTEFTTNSLGNSAGTYTPNVNGVTYVAYIFAHNAGGFGLTGTDNVISCGSYTGSGSAGKVINLGFEPQWVLIKNSTAGSYTNWFIFDNMRGMAVGNGDPYLYANSANAEAGGSAQYIDPTATGFNMMNANVINESGQTYIYIAIRRGPMKVPTDATKVFKPVARAGTSAAEIITGVGFPPDSALIKNRAGNTNSVDWSFNFFDKLRKPGYRLSTGFTNAEDTSVNFITSFDQDGMTLPSIGYTATNGSYNYINYFFRRAPSFFDEVCMDGTNTTDKAHAHNLGVAPELVICKDRTGSSAYWVAYAAPLGKDKYLVLNNTDAEASFANFWGTSAPNASNIYFTDTTVWAASSGNKGVMYLFATCPGVSKVGSYTGTGTTQTINCGFTGGARFVMIKRTDSAASWYVWDTARGMVSGTDPSLQVNYYSGEVNGNSIYTTTTGFQIVASPYVDVNASGGTYIFLAIA